MQYDNWNRQTIKIADIDLDPENIRLDIDQKTQEDLMADLFANEDAMEVLESIARNGIYPDEQPIVVKDGSRYMMLEGNRRLAALKALNNPSLIKSLTSKISILAATFPGIDSIEVQVAPGKAEVQRHLANRHTAVTRRAWKPLRQAYFYTALLKNGKSVTDLLQEFPGVDIQKFVRNWEMHQLLSSVSIGDHELDKKVRDQRNFPISTLSRLFDDKSFRAAYGIEFDADGHLKLPADRTKLDAALKKIATDIVDKNSASPIDTRTLNNEKGIAAYREKLEAGTQPAGPTNDADAAGPAGTLTLSTPAATAPTVPSVPPTPTTTMPTTPRTKLAPANITMTITSPGMQRLLKELQDINYRQFPISAHDSLRTFLECALKCYFDAKGHTLTSRRGGFVHLDQVLDEFGTDANGWGTPATRQIARRIRSTPKMVSYSAEFLNANNHNPDVFPSPDEVKQAWGSMESLFRVILNP